jgi:hypothetical protein
MLSDFVIEGRKLDFCDSFRMQTGLSLDKNSILQIVVRWTPQITVQGTEYILY